MSRNVGTCILLIHGFILALIVILPLYFYSFDPKENVYVYINCVLLLLLFIWSLWSWNKLTKSLFDPYILFFLAAAIFNGAHAFLEIFHLNEIGILNGAFSIEIIYKSLYLVLIGLASLHCGALISALNRRRLPNSDENKRITPISQDVRIVGWVFLFIAIIPAYYIFKSYVNIVLSSGYFGIYTQETVTGLEASPRVLATFLVPAALFLLAGSKHRPFCIGVSGVIIIIYSLVQFFIGSRGWGIMALIAFAWLWHRSVFPIPKVLLVGGGIFSLFVLFPLINVVRNSSGLGRYSTGVFTDAFNSISNPVVFILSELGRSMGTIAHTISLVPDVRGFDFGLGYIFALFSVFPNLFWKLHPSVVLGSPSIWLIRTVDPNYAALGGGLGYSFIAEAYLNFGTPGVMIISMLIGFLLGKFIFWALKSLNPAKMAMVTSFLAFFLYFARGESVSIIRPLVWYSFFPYCCTYLVMWLRKKIIKNTLNMTSGA